MPLSVAFQLCRTFKPRLVHLVSWSELQKPDSFSPLRWWKWKAMPFIAVMLLQISLCANCTGFPRLILPSEAIQGWIQCYFNVLHAGSCKILNEIDLLLFNFSMFCAKKFSDFSCFAMAVKVHNMCFWEWLGNGVHFFPQWVNFLVSGVLAWKELIWQLHCLKNGGEWNSAEPSCADGIGTCSEDSTWHHSLFLLALNIFLQEETTWALGYTLHLFFPCLVDGPIDQWKGKSMAV